MAISAFAAEDDYCGGATINGNNICVGCALFVGITSRKVSCILDANMELL
jgi:hypothetical protein